MQTTIYFRDHQYKPQTPMKPKVLLPYCPPAAVSRQGRRKMMEILSMISLIMVGGILIHHKYK